MNKKTVIAIMIGCMTQFANAQSLEQAVSQTLQNNPKIKEAYDLYLSRQHQIDEAKAGYMPKLDLVAGVGPERITPAGSDDTSSLTRKDLSLSLRQMLFDGFDTSSNVDRTDAEAKAQRLALVSTAENTALRVAEVYLAMLKQEEIYAL